MIKQSKQRRKYGNFFCSIRAVVFDGWDFIHLQHLGGFKMILPVGTRPEPKIDVNFEDLSLDEAIKKHICNTLIKAKGNKALAAKNLKIQRSTLYRNMVKYGISYEKILLY